MINVAMLNRLEGDQHSDPPAVVKDYSQRPLMVAEALVEKLLGVKGVAEEDAVEEAEVEAEDEVEAELDEMDGEMDEPPDADVDLDSD